MPALTATTRGRGLVRRALGPRRDAVAAAELLGLPRPHRLEASARSRRAAYRRAATARWPAKLAYHVCEWTRSAPTQSPAMLTSTPSVCSAAFAAASSGRSAYAVVPGLVARGAEAAHLHVDVAARAQRPDELCHVHTRASVDGRRVLLAEDVDAHAPTLVPLASRGAESSGDLACWTCQRADRCPRVALMARRSPAAGPKVLAIVLAGGEGKRLMPLTADRAKPAVPFGGIYRLIDFALSNVVNSGYLKVVVLTQYKSHSLDAHVTETWRMSTLLGNYVATVPAQQRVGKHWYLGSADAIFQSLNLIHDEQPDIVVVVGADHVYRMDFSQMVEQHIESGAGVHRRRDPPADLARRPVRRHRGRRRRPDARSPSSSRSRATPRACPTPPTRCSPRWATTSSTPTRSIEAVTDRPRDRLEPRHGRRHRPLLRGARRGRRLRLQGQRRARRHRPRPRLLARRRDHRRRTSTRTWTSSRSTRSSTSTTTSGRSTPSTAPPAGEVRARQRRPHRRGAQLGGLPRRRRLGRPRLRARCSRRSCRCTPTRASRARCCSTTSRSTGTPDPPGDHRQERRRPRGRQIGIDHEHDRARGFHVTETGIVVVGKGQVVTR